jgi:hypothetical protein
MSPTRFLCATEHLDFVIIDDVIKNYKFYLLGEAEKEVPMYQSIHSST